MTGKQWKEKSTQVLEAVRKSAETEDEIIRAQSHYCSRHGRLVKPAECHDCFRNQPPSVRLLGGGNRQTCIQKHKVKEESVASTNLPSSINPKPISVGKKVTVTVEKGQDPIRVQITAEMAADREAALNYASEAVRNKTMAEVQLCVAAALYLGDGIHAPWVIDGFSSPQEAAQVMLGWTAAVASRRRRIGQQLIDAYGKEQVLEKAKGIGVASLPYYKLRELLRFPRQFEKLLTSGHIALPSGEQITIDTILETGIDKLPQLFEQIAAQPVQQKGVKKQGINGWAGRNPMTGTTAAETEELILVTLSQLKTRLKVLLVGLANEVAGWPKNAKKVIEGSGKLQEELTEIEDLMARALNGFCILQREPGKVHDVVRTKTEGLLIFKQAMEGLE